MVDINELKARNPMPDVLRMYGLTPNRGKIRCPFHGDDRHPSMQVYADGVHCFTCGAHHDQIAFIQQMDNCSFKDAVEKLGGALEPATSRAAHTRAVFQAEKEKQKAAKEQLLHDVQQELAFVVQTCYGKDEFKSNMALWTFLANAEGYFGEIYDEIYIQGKEVDLTSVLRKCGLFRERIIALTGTV